MDCFEELLDFLNGDVLLGSNSNLSNSWDSVVSLTTLDFNYFNLRFNALHNSGKLLDGTASVLVDLNTAVTTKITTDF